MASNGQPPANPPQTPQPTSQQLAATSNIISALGQVLKNQTGEAPQNDKIAQLLLANMAQLSQLLKSGKLNQTQIEQLREFVDKNKAGGSSASATPAPVAPSPVATPGPSTARYTPPTHVTIPQSINPAFKSAQAATTLTSQAGGGFPISNTLSTTNPGPITWATAQQGRPTLSGGIPGGRISGTPSQLSRTADDASMLSSDTSSRRKNSPNDQSMRRSIQELVSSIDPSVKIEPEVEDLLLDIADEFIDSVTNFGCRLAKHRGGESLEVRDLQLHLERNHNIRIPGFASDETRISISQSIIAPAAGAGGASSSNKKNAQSSQMTLRSHRLAQVSQAKKEAKLM